MNLRAAQIERRDGRFSRSSGRETKGMVSFGVERKKAYTNFKGSGQALNSLCSLQGLRKERPRAMGTHNRGCQTSRQYRRHSGASQTARTNGRKAHACRDATDKLMQHTPQDKWAEALAWITQGAR
jgi:hypothetical protein